jgi:serine/threonine protein phosphatase PrpC
MKMSDALLLCSDGLHGYVEDEEVERILMTTPPAGAIDRFIDLVYACNGRDNVTALLIWPEE